MKPTHAGLIAVALLAMTSSGIAQTAPALPGPSDTRGGAIIMPGDPGSPVDDDVAKQYQREVERRKAERAREARRPSSGVGTSMGAAPTGTPDREVRAYRTGERSILPAGMATQ